MNRPRHRVARIPRCRAGASPQLLGRLTVDEAGEDRLLPRPDLAPRAVLAAAAEAGRLQRQVRRWRRATAAAAAAAVLALVIIATDPFGGRPPLDPPIVAGVVGVSADAAATEGQASAYAWDWGTTVELELAQLPARDRYVVITVADDGRREQAGTWGATAARAARVRSASSIQRDDLRRVEVTDADGAVLFTFDFDA